MLCLYIKTLYMENLFSEDFPFQRTRFRLIPYDWSIYSQQQQQPVIRIENRQQQQHQIATTPAKKRHSRTGSQKVRIHMVSDLRQ